MSFFFLFGRMFTMYCFVKTTAKMKLSNNILILKTLEHIYSSFFFFAVSLFKKMKHYIEALYIYIYNI